MTEQHFPLTPQHIDDAVNSAIELNLDRRVQDALHKQSWYRRYANTINASIGVVSTLAASLLAADLDLSDPVRVGIAVVGAVGTILGVKQTVNGLPADTAHRLK